MDNQFEQILQKARQERITPEEALRLFKATEDPELAEELYAAARDVRHHTRGDVFYYHAGIASVTPCALKPLCRYCPYWRDAGRRCLELPEILRGVQYIKEHNVGKICLSGGTVEAEEGRDVLKIVRGIRQAGHTDVEISVNCGATMPDEVLREMKELGVVRIGASFEIMNPRVFRAVKPGDNLEKKIAFAHKLEDYGIQTMTAVMAGLGPQESRYEDYVLSLFSLLEFPNLDYVYISKFQPAATTPMKDYPPCGIEEGKRLVAMARLVLRGLDLGSAAGWNWDQRHLPVWAGAGTSLLGIHVNRNSRYWKANPEEQDIDRVEFIDTRDDQRKNVEAYGLSVEA
ncbi:biotin synthase [Sporobacter termitidis DSM 10068]|uniref:Biotin synthase n=1 Tax=Sporobacter termitidis DSM 10068 TaxID=1123282 RepID=A0A1M5XD55_9FIRM|nr:radical SAM protein [Sporobacter termitidis]SHH97434.1 biotin synthase [Sporobacter termitidis DSM 10068]